MYAIILAAGKGERLKNIGKKIPKPMILYKGKPLLQYNIEACVDNNITNIFINTYHLPDNIIDYFGDGSQFGAKIIYSHEKKLLGTAGAVRKIMEENGFDKKEPFFVLYGDNYSEFPISELIKVATTKKADTVIAFHWREDTTSSGVAEFNEDMSIRRFIEKPPKGTIDSNWVNAGIYYLTPTILNYIPYGFSDFSKDIFPKLLMNNHKIYGACFDVPVLAFDTIKLLNINIK